MNLIAIDASTEACSVALSYQGQLYTRYELCPQSHSLLLLPMVDQVLAEAGCRLNDLDALVYGRGPGSFTGVRIGVGVAQGLAYSCNLRTVGVSTLQAMAQQAYRRFGQTTVFAAIDARMSEVYNAAFVLDEQKLMQPQSQESVLPPAKLAEHLSADKVIAPAFGVGTGWQAYQQDLAALITNVDDIEVLYPQAEDMLVLAQPLVAAGQAQSAENAQPVYVRDTVSWQKLPGRE